MAKATSSVKQSFIIPNHTKNSGITLGLYDGSEIDPSLYKRYTGKAKKIN